MIVEGEIEDAVEEGESDDVEVGGGSAGGGGGDDEDDEEGAMTAVDNGDWDDEL